MLRWKNYFWKWCLQTNKTITCNFDVLFVNSKKQICLFTCKLRNLEHIYFLMCCWIMDATPLFFSLLLEGLPSYVFNKCTCNSYEKVLLYDFPCAHRLAKHKKLPLLLVLNILGQENYPKIIDSAFDFCLWFFEIKELIDILHLRYWLFRVTDYDNLIVTSWENPFHCCDFVKLWNFFFDIYHI